MKPLPSVLFVLASVATACTSYELLTAPPPGRVAQVNDRRKEISLSTGVALAMECRTAWNNPCASQVRVDDPKIAGVYPAYLNKVDWFLDGKATPTSFVVVGLRPGTTVLRVAGEDPLHVMVHDP